MRVKAPISAGVRVAAAGVTMLCLFASGPALSASGQAPAPTPSATQSAPTRPLNASAAPTVMKITPDEAVRMALENNLGVQADRLGPQIETYGVAEARAAYALTLSSLTTTRSATQPPTDFLSSSNSVLTNDSFRTNAGIEQLVPWGGGRYSLGIDAARATSSNPTNPFNPQLDSGLGASYTQPLLRNFTFDSARQNVALSQKRQEIADIQLRQTLTQTSRIVRNAYFNLVNAIGQLQVAQKSLELAQTSLRNNEKKVQLGTIAPIDIVQAEAEVARTEEQVIVAEGQIGSAEDALRVFIMNPSQPDFWTTKLEPGEQPTLAPQPINLEAAITNALANRTDILQARKTVDQTDINMKYLRNQKLPALDVTGNYSAVGIAGTQRLFDNSRGSFRRLSALSRSGASATRWATSSPTISRRGACVFNLSYPLGTSQADAGLAQAKLQRDQQTTNLRDLETAIVAQVRDAARQVDDGAQAGRNDTESPPARRAEPSGVREAPRRRIVGYVPRDSGSARSDRPAE